MPALNLHSTIQPSHGGAIPVIGLGTWKTPEGSDVINSVRWALEAGYRHIDTAKIYRNEDGVGRAIRESGVPRDQIFVTTKLWNHDQGHHSALRAIDESLNKLGLDYVDLYLVHWPTADWPLVSPDQSVNKRVETWQAMEEILRSGKAKAIGVSNYTQRHLEEMKGYAKILPAVNQVEFHPFLYQKELLDYCQKQGIVLEAYCPLVHGEKLNDERITAIAKPYNKSNAQILIRWSLQHGCVVLPKSIRQERLRENLNVFDFEISGRDMEALDALNENLRVTWDPSAIP